MLRRSWLYEYDACKNLTTKRCSNTPNGPGVSASGGPHQPWPDETTVYQITYEGNCQKSSVLEYFNSKLKKSTHIYRAADTVISKTTKYRFDGEESKIHTTKTIDSLRIELVTFPGSSDQYNDQSIYVHNQLSSYVSMSGDEIRFQKDYQTQYHYDERGNWIKKEDFENGVLVRITKREITYR